MMQVVNATDARAPDVQTFDRGLKVLHLLATKPDGLSVSARPSREPSPCS